MSLKELPTGFTEIPELRKEILEYTIENKQTEEIFFDEKTLRFFYNVVYSYDIDISLFRIRDTVIPARYVKLMFSPVNARVEWIAMDINNKYNIYPTRRIRKDGRIEIPRKITERFRLRSKIIKGQRTFTVFVKYIINPESKELVMYLPYREEEKDRLYDYKTVKWFPITFIYRDWIDKAITLRYLHYGEMFILFNSSFCWLYDFRRNQPRYKIENLRLGLTNRNKDFVITKPEYEKVLSFIIIKDKITGKPVGVKDARIFYRSILLDAWERSFKRLRCGWDTVQAKTYPECSYDIYLDVDSNVVDKYGTIDDYLKYLIPKLKQLDVKGRMYVIVSSYTIIPPKYNYHIIIESKLPFDKWINVINLLEEDTLRKPFARLQGFNILRISSYSTCDLKLLYTIEI